VPGIYFAGSVTQGHAGLRKYGFPSRSASVAGFRYNSVVQARHIARTHFGIQLPRPSIAPERVIPYLLAQATRGAEVWSQQSHLARVVSLDRGDGIRDEGVVPLAPFVDAAGPDAVAVAVETDPQQDIHPAVYVRRNGKVQEHLLAGSPRRDFESPEHQAQLSDLLKGLLP
jgi:hypothetical protein